MKTGLDAVVKVGGSLSRGEALASLCQKIGELGQQYRLLAVPGGGDFADAVRVHYRRYRLGETTAHQMALLAMDQYGYLLSDLIPGGTPARGLMSVRQIIAVGRVPVLLPCSLLQQADPLPHSWAVTSDSIAAWVAEWVGSPMLVLLKDVDGLYPADPRIPSGKDGSTLLESVTLDQLAACGGVDRHLARFLSGASLDVWIISGERPERLAELLSTGRTRGTHLRR